LALVVELVKQAPAWELAVVPRTLGLAWALAVVPQTLGPVSALAPVKLAPVWVLAAVPGKRELAWALVVVPAKPGLALVLELVPVKREAAWVWELLTRGPVSELDQPLGSYPSLKWDFASRNRDLIFQSGFPGLLRISPAHRKRASTSK
jgi:hypothetical protein